jgi:hypothetical protein
LLFKTRATARQYGLRQPANQAESKTTKPRRLGRGSLTRILHAKNAAEGLQNAADGACDFSGDAAIAPEAVAFARAGSVAITVSAANNTIQVCQRNFIELVHSHSPVSGRGHPLNPWSNGYAGVELAAVTGITQTSHKEYNGPEGL